MLRIGKCGGNTSDRLLASIRARFPNIELVEVGFESGRAQIDQCGAIWIHGVAPASRDLCVQAATAGKPLLVDMRSLSEEVIAVCSAAPIRCMAGKSLRFRPSMQSVKEQLDTGTLGEPGLLRIHSWESADPADPISQTPCVREIDLACWLFRQSPTQVYAVASSSEVLPETNDYTQVHLGFANGGMSLIDKCRSLPAGDSYFSLSMIGSTGAAYADDHRNMQLSFRGGRPSAVNTGQEIAEAVLELQEFIDAIEQDREPSITIADVKTTALVTMAITESLESKQPVSLEPGP